MSKPAKGDVSPEIPDDGEGAVFLEALRQAEDDIQAGRLISNEEVKARLESWLSA